MSMTSRKMFSIGVRNNQKPMKPFVKWAGGKGQILNEIRKHYPSELGSTILKYAEPFVGGGAVLFDILNNYSMEKIYISDTNAELISTYQVIQEKPIELIEKLMQYQKEYVPLDIDKRKNYFYEKRNLYNNLKLNKHNIVELAVVFIFLNRTCFNGLYRVNSKGEFNVPIGRYVNPLICDAENILSVSKGLTNVEIVCADYRESDAFIDENTFVYFDPPYRPLNVSSSFTAYTEINFDDNDQSELASYIRLLADRGAKVLTSNSDPKNTDSEDMFFDHLYSGFEIKRINASRVINSDVNSRKKIYELLISS